MTGTVYGTYQNQYGDTLVLNSDGTFSGQAPVNTFKGTYEIVDGCVVLKDFSITKMAGSEDDMRHEASFLEKLEAEEYTFVIDSFLFGSDGNTMLHIFFRV
ncbi:MAG TPA: META domain-containing protein [Methanocorpusculum sp.]|nr:META domain-containing protein [Methanocorpusculum sp.]